MSDTASETASSIGDIIEDASEADTTTFKCLFCDEQWSRVPDMFTHCKKDHGFDTVESIKQLGKGQFTPVLCLVCGLRSGYLLITCSSRRINHY